VFEAGVDLEIEEEEGGVVVQQRRVPQQRLLSGLRFRVEGSGLGFRVVDNLGINLAKMEMD